MMPVVRRYLWCVVCEQRTAARGGDLCARCAGAVAAGLDAMLDEAVLPCAHAPVGWWCSRGAGHDGPCALRLCARRSVRRSVRAWLNVLRLRWELRTRGV